MIDSPQPMSLHNLNPCSGKTFERLKVFFALRSFHSGLSSRARIGSEGEDSKPTVLTATT